jgi:DNA-binding HxlR family transcriptional regulator
VVRALSGRSRRFSELLRDIPQIPSKSLARVLSKLEMEGLIRREVNAGRPPQVTYSLIGNDPLMSDVIDALFRWGSKHELSGKVLKGLAKEPRKGPV